MASLEEIAERIDRVLGKFGDSEEGVQFLLGYAAGRYEAFTKKSAITTLLKNVVAAGLSAAVATLSERWRAGKTK